MGRVSVSSTRYTGAGSGEGITGGVERADPASEIAWDNRAQPDEAAQREFGRFEGHLVWRILVSSRIDPTAARRMGGRLRGVSP